MEDDTRSVSRRGFLTAAAGTAATTAAAGTATAQESTTHTVEMTDQLVFDPDEITIAPGDTVVWENVGTVGHSVTAYEDEIPEDAEYFASGGFDSEQAARNAYPQQGDIAGGESYEHTFEVTGDYEYFCIPHEAVGMVGTVTVQEGGAQTPTGGGAPAVSDTAKSIAVAAASVLVAVLALAYFFIRYGGDYGVDEA
ncbi:plastocyanin/azurin family copper-binding protein [Haloplanus sp. GCM10025708]|uniref:plastocyanin/azurin family copper-binding protein n=1 Tax=Haloferacaceae TaxID=1644056 RepID=UPI00361A78FD